MVCCHVCGSTATAHCARCERAAYCGAECQLRDWRQGGHKRECFDVHTPEDGLALAREIFADVETRAAHLGEEVVAKGNELVRDLMMEHIMTEFFGEHPDLIEETLADPEMQAIEVDEAMPENIEARAEALLWLDCHRIGGSIAHDADEVVRIEACIDGVPEAAVPLRVLIGEDFAERVVRVNQTHREWYARVDNAFTDKVRDAWEKVKEGGRNVARGAKAAAKRAKDAIKRGAQRAAAAAGRAKLAIRRKARELKVKAGQFKDTLVTRVRAKKRELSERWQKSRQAASERRAQRQREAQSRREQQQRDKAARDQQRRDEQQRRAEDKRQRDLDRQRELDDARRAAREASEADARERQRQADAERRAATIVVQPASPPQPRRQQPPPPPRYSVTLPPAPTVVPVLPPPPAPRATQFEAPPALLTSRLALAGAVSVERDVERQSKLLSIAMSDIRGGYAPQVLRQQEYYAHSRLEAAYHSLGLADAQLNVLTRSPALFQVDEVDRDRWENIVPRVQKSLRKDVENMQQIKLQDTTLTGAAIRGIDHVIADLNDAINALADIPLNK